MTNKLVMLLEHAELGVVQVLLKHSAAFVVHIYAHGGVFPDSY